MPNSPLSPLAAAGWGMLGGFIVEALELAAALRRAKAPPWKRPGEPKLPAYLLSVVFRLAGGAALAAIAGGSGQVATPFAAGVIGITAPLVVEKLLSQASITLPRAAQKTGQLDDH